MTRGVWGVPHVRGCGAQPLWGSTGLASGLLAAGLTLPLVLSFFPFFLPFLFSLAPSLCLSYFLSFLLPLFACFRVAFVCPLVGVWLSLCKSSRFLP